jgi:hypothetical protein
MREKKIDVKLNLTLSWTRTTRVNQNDKQKLKKKGVHSKGVACELLGIKIYVQAQTTHIYMD